VRLAGLYVRAENRQNAYCSDAGPDSTSHTGKPVADFLCDVLVFVEEVSCAVSALVAEGLEVDHVFRQRLERGGLADSPVRAMFVVQGFVLAQQSE
jgi:hypothetical protein